MSEMTPVGVMSCPRCEEELPPCVGRVGVSWETVVGNVTRVATTDIWTSFVG